MATDVVVIGAGAIGLWTAFRLARQGARVDVVDPEPGRGATWAAAGMLAPVTEYIYGEEPLLGLTVAAAARYESDAAELGEASGLDAGYRRSGAVEAAWDAADLDALRDLAGRRRELGIAVERLGSRALHAAEPALAPGLAGGYLADDDHQVDNRMMVRALLAALDRLPVTFHRGCATRIAMDERRAVGVDVDGGRQARGRWTVLAAGAHSGRLAAGAPGVRLPIRPVKGQTIRLLADKPILRHVVRGRVRGAPVYIVERAHGEIVIGASSEDAGFDRRPRAGAVHDLLRDAVLLAPELAEAQWSEVSTGLRPGTPDNGPIVGPISGVEGLIVATGHYRNGVLLAPITADAVAAHIAGTDGPPSMRPFGPDRFDAATEGGSR